jgi:hypothetical protein
VIVTLAYIFDSEENMESNVDNGVLNVARHSCEYLDYAATRMYECTLNGSTLSLHGLDV